MSEPVTALGGVSWDQGIATVSEAPLQGMITLRGDLSDAKVRAAAADAAQVEVPEQGHGNVTDDRGICWMSPDELLVLCSYDSVGERLDRMHEALGDTHALAVNVSDARAVFDLSGLHAREVLAKLAPVDLAPDAFTPGMFRRTRLAQVAAAFWLQGEDRFRIVCFRSHAQYVFDLLKVAAQPGSEVRYF